MPRYLFLRSLFRNNLFVDIDFARLSVLLTLRNFVANDGPFLTSGIFHQFPLSKSPNILLFTRAC